MAVDGVIFVPGPGRLPQRVQRALIAGIALCLISLLALSGCEVEPGPGGPYTENATTTAPPTFNIEIPRLEKQIHDLVNAERAKAGLTQLDWNPELNRIAAAHSQDMATRSYLSHYSPEGHDFVYRYKQAGFSTRAGGGENLFQCSVLKSQSFVGGIPTKSEYYSESDIASLTVDSWMRSPTHRQNILTPRWRTEGIGVAISPYGEVYVTQNFG